MIYSSFSTWKRAVNREVEAIAGLGCDSVCINKDQTKGIVLKCYTAALFHGAVIPGLKCAH